MYREGSVSLLRASPREVGTMTGSSRHEDGPPDEGREGRLPGWAVGVLTMEAIALGIAVAMPVTPSKTGSTWSPAHLFSPDPTYLEEVGASFVVVNVILLGLGLVAWAVSRRSRSE
jgi:hypothetical protein